MTLTNLVIAVLLFLVIGGIILFNRLIRKRNFCRNAFAQIDVQLTRRHDLVPNLVEVAKKYLQHERETLEVVIATRARADSSLTASREDIGSLALMRALSSTEHAFSSALGGFMATVEAYPELKANLQMTKLSEELVHTENRIAFARQAYNDGVMFYNNERQSFPANLIALLCGFKEMGALDLEFDAEPTKVFQ